MSEQLYHGDFDLENHKGFRSALFVNFPTYDPNNKIKNILDSAESVRLSIESMTPNTAERKQAPCESNFKFCLSKDLMQRLEENSPLKACNAKGGLTGPDICLIKCADEQNSDEDLQDRSEFFEYDVMSENIFRNPILSNYSLNTQKNSHDVITNTPYTSQDVFNPEPNFSYQVPDKKLIIEGVSSNNIQAESYYPSFNRYQNNGIFNCKNNSNNLVNSQQIKNYIQNNINGNNINYNAITNINGAITTSIVNGKFGWYCTACKNFNYEGNIKNLFIL